MEAAAQDAIFAEIVVPRASRHRIADVLGLIAQPGTIGVFFIGGLGEEP